MFDSRQPDTHDEPSGDGSDLTRRPSRVRSSGRAFFAEVVDLADTPVSEAGAFGQAGSTPALGMVRSRSWRS